MKLAEYPIEFDANQHLESLIGEYRDLALRQTSSTGSDTARWES